MKIEHFSIGPLSQFLGFSVFLFFAFDPKNYGTG